jgi:hypothetical protein
MSRRIQNEIIRRFFWYMKNSGNIGNAFAAALADAEHLGELAQHQVVECLLPKIAICFANKYNEMTELYDDEPDPQDLFETFCKFEGVSDAMSDVIAISINEGAAALLHEELKDDDDDHDEDADENIVFSSADYWKNLSDEQRQAKVKAFLRKLAHAHRDIADYKPFLKNLNIGDQENPYGIKVGSKVKMRPSHDPRTNEATMFPNLFQSSASEPRNHPLQQTLVKHGYSYSHTTPVNQHDGCVHNHHTWVHPNGHQLGAYANDTKWSSKVSAVSGHVHTGIGTRAFDAHLANKARRYKNESAAIPHTDLLENLMGGQDEVQAYADWIARTPESLLSAPINKTSPAQEHRETWKMQNRQRKLFGDGPPATDWETRGLMNREKQ